MSVTGQVLYDDLVGLYKLRSKSRNRLRRQVLASPVVHRAGIDCPAGWIDDRGMTGQYREILEEVRTDVAGTLWEVMYDKIPVRDKPAPTPGQWKLLFKLTASGATLQELSNCYSACLRKSAAANSLQALYRRALYPQRQDVIKGPVGEALAWRTLKIHDDGTETIVEEGEYPCAGNTYSVPMPPAAEVGSYIRPDAAWTFATHYQDRSGHEVEIVAMANPFSQVLDADTLRRLEDKVREYRPPAQTRKDKRESAKQALWALYDVIAGAGDPPSPSDRLYHAYQRAKPILQRLYNEVLEEEKLLPRPEGTWTKRIDGDRVYWTRVTEELVG